MKAIKKMLQLILVGVCTCFAAIAIGGCSKVPDWYTGFTADYDPDVIIGTQIQLNDYIDFVQLNPDTGDWETALYDPEYEFADYTLTLSKGNVSIDLTGKDIWELSGKVTPGEWTFTYTVTEKCEFKGKFTAPLNILAPRVKVNYTKNSPALSQFLGETLNFEDFFSELNLDIDSYYDYTVEMTEVFYRGTTFDLVGETQYKFGSTGVFVFTFKVAAEDNQTVEEIVRVNVAYNQIGRTAVYLRQGDMGNVEIDVDSTVSDVKINGEDLEYIATAEGLIVTYEELYKFPGVCEISFALESGVYCAYVVEVITEHITFNAGGALSAFGVGYYRIGDKGYDLLRDWTTHKHGENGNYMLGTDQASGSATLYFTISQAYVDYAFKDPEVDYIEFEFYAPCVIQTGMVSDGAGGEQPILDKYTEASELYPFTAELGYSYKMKMYREFFYSPISETHYRMNEHILDEDDIADGDPAVDSVEGERYRVILSGDQTPEGWIKPGYFFVDNVKLGFNE